MSWTPAAVTAAIAAAAVLLPAPGEAADPVVKGTFRGASKAVQFDISPPLRSIPARPAGLKRDAEEESEGDSGLEQAPGIQHPDGARQDKVLGAPPPAPIVSFDTVNGLGSNPPDSVGEVGPNHYVVMSNLRFAVYPKTGGAPLFGPVANNTLWAGFGGPCQTQNAGDPVVLHDQLSDRWILMQFTATGPEFFLCTAVSQTADPTGAYFRYAFSTGVNFPDYPKFGIWPDGVYFSTREFGPAGPFSGIGAYAVDRAQLIAGNPTPTIISFVVPPGATPFNTGDGLLPADLDGTVLPPAGSPNDWVGSMDAGGPYGAPQDALTFWRFVANFANPPASSFTLTNTVPIATYDTLFPCVTQRDCIPQPGVPSSQFLDILAYRQRPMHRLAYRNFGTHESLVTNQSVEAGAGPGGPVAGIRWWEIRNPATTPTIFQEGTFAPGLTDGVHRWMGSIAQDRAGNMALGYSVSSTTVFPGIRYTGRLVSDAPGVMAQGEGTFVNGVGVQTTTNSRWGDYTSMNVDPSDDCTFYFIGEYYPVTSAAGWMLRVGAFRYPAPECIPVPVELQTFTVQD
jgi:hypothetical protein